MTRMNLVHLCVPLTSRMCWSAKPATTLNTLLKASQTWTHLCCGVQGGRQVLSSRCGWLSGVHFHSSSRWAAPSTPDPEDRHGDDESSATHHVLNDTDPDFLPTQHKQHFHTTDKVMGTLMDLFGLSYKDAQYVLVSSFAPKLTEQDVLHNLHCLKKCGITGAQLHRIPWILCHKSDILSKKLVKIKQPHLFRECSEGLGFCYLSMEQMTMYQRYFIREISDFPNHPNRIYYLAERIQVPVELFTEKIGKPHKTLIMKKKRLDLMIDMFHRYGLSPEDVVSDLWVFGYGVSKAEERLKRAVDIGCTELRPWMCRCSDKIFDRFCERYQCRKELMGEHESLFSYLAERLECEPSLLERAFQSNMVMKKVHISKFSRILDLLFAEGITAREIRSCMRVFQYSEERTAARIKELKSIGFFPFPMVLLSRTPGQFRDIVSQYRKRFKEQSQDQNT